MLRNEISVFVKERVISLQPNYTNPVAGNVDHDYLEVNFDHEWDGLDKRVTFYGVNTGAITMPLDEDDKVRIPWESIQYAGQMALTFVGSENGVDRLVTTDLERDKRLRIVAAGDDMGVSPDGPTLDLYERIKRLTEQLEGQVESGDFGLSFKELSVNQIDENGVPTITDPNPNVIYVAPASKTARADENYEWFWFESKWERFGKDYILPAATAEVLGGIKVGKNLTVDEDGTLNAADPTVAYELPQATEDTLGGVKVGDNLDIAEDGTLSAVVPEVEEYVLPAATTSTLGGVKVGKNLTVDTDGTLNAEAEVFELPQATAEVLGGIKLGDHLVYDAETGLTDAVALKGDKGDNGDPGDPGEDGYTPVKGVDYFTPAEITEIKNDILSQVGGSGEDITIQPYILPPATATTLGGIKIGSNLTVTEDGTLSADATPVESYELPQATSETLGGIKLGSHLVFDPETGLTDAVVLQGDKGDDGAPGEPGQDGAPGQDGYTPVKGIDYFTQDEINDIAQAAADLVEIDPYELPVATTETLGGVKIGDNLNVTEDGTLSAVIPEIDEYALPVASAEVLGGVKIGSNLSIDENGVLSADAESYELPKATDEILGGVKMGIGVNIVDGVISVSDDYINTLIETKLAEMYQVGHTWGDIETGGFLQPVPVVTEE